MKTKTKALRGFFFVCTSAVTISYTLLIAKLKLLGYYSITATNKLVIQMQNTFGFFLLVLIPIFYFLPTVVANIRNHKNKTAILILNIFLGWTFLFWVGALVWASLKTENQQPIINQSNDAAKVAAWSAVKV